MQKQVKVGLTQDEIRTLRIAVRVWMATTTELLSMSASKELRQATMDEAAILGRLSTKLEGAARAANS